MTVAACPCCTGYGRRPVAPWDPRAGATPPVVEPCAACASTGLVRDDGAPAPAAESLAETLAKRLREAFERARDETPRDPFAPILRPLPFIPRLADPLPLGPIWIAPMPPVGYPNGFPGGEVICAAGVGP